jgi:UPF0716 protein FxsA
VLLFLVLAFVVAPIVEIGVFIAVGQWIGFGPALAVLLAVAVIGVWVVKRQGTGVLRRAQAELSAGRVPTFELVDGSLLLAAGVLLVLPGFVSDVVGLVLLVPPVRHVPSRWVRRRAAVRVAHQVGSVGTAVVVRSRERRGSGDGVPPGGVPPALGQ